MSVLRTEWEDDPCGWGRSSSPCGARQPRRLVNVLSDGRRVPQDSVDDKVRVWYRLGRRNGTWHILLLARDACTVHDLKVAVMRAEGLVDSPADFDLTVTPSGGETEPLADSTELRDDASYVLRRVGVKDPTHSLPRMCRGEAVLPLSMRA